jgi:hypothetical protein
VLAKLFFMADLLVGAFGWPSVSASLGIARISGVSIANTSETDVFDLLRDFRSWFDEVGADEIESVAGSGKGPAPR